jgi:catechol 2,3-dioxygenase-like lactoylglutathione lyase family enzyme
MIKVHDTAYVGYTVPDLDKMEEFLTDFGMVRAERTDTRLYMRGAGPSPYIHMSEKGDPGFIALGLTVKTEAELGLATEIEGASQIEDINGPGGGKRVRLSGPDGFRIDIVHGRDTVENPPLRDPLKINYATEKERISEFQRPDNGPAMVSRLGHCVFKVTDGVAGAQWLHDNLGMLQSDRLMAPDDEDAVLGTFMRCDRGQDFTDHHTILVLHAPGDVKIHHSSYEIQDYDSQHFGHEVLMNKGWHHEWGVGRHLLGSQVFDYWRDPWGHMHEHYTDGDLVTADVKPGTFPANQENLAQWGPEVSPTFFD